MMKWPCAIQQCDLPAVRALCGQCELCHLHFCSTHVASPLHTCPTNEDILAIQISGDPALLEDLNLRRQSAGERVISKLLDSINHDALSQRAEALREGIKCTVSLPSADKAYFNFDILGGRNYHATIEFEDGKIWLARFRLPNHENPLSQERNFDRCSEFATYRYLARAGIQVPMVYDCANDDDPENMVGAGYILLEKLGGKPLEWHEASDVQKEGFLRQLAEVYVVLEQHPFDMMGRLQLSSNGVPEVGPAFFDHDDSGKLIPYGPFNSSNGYYTALIQQRIKLIESKELAATFPLAQLLVYKTLIDSLPPNETASFFLRHVDSRDANILVDDNYNITGIIDWEFAIVTPRSSAFQSPLLLYNLGELNHQGLSTPSRDEKRFSKILQEKEQAKLAALAEQKLHFRVEQVLEADPLAWERFKRQFGGWWKLAYGMDVFDWDAWYEEALEKYGTESL